MDRLKWEQLSAKQDQALMKATENVLKEVTLPQAINFDRIPTMMINVYSLRKD